MKKIVFLFSFLLCSSIFAASGDSGADSGSIVSSTGGVENSGGLVIQDVVSKNLDSVNITFDQKVQTESVKVKVVKQSDNSSLSIKEITADPDSQNNPNTIIVHFKDKAEASTSYKITVVSATSESGGNIKEGIDAIREFATIASADPASTDESKMTLNAPENTAAVLATANTAATTQSQAITPAPKGIQNKKTEILEKSETLPKTGMNPFFLILIAFPVGVLFFLKRKSL